MSTFAPIKSTKPSKVHYSEYIRVEDRPEEGSTNPVAPSEPVKPAAE